jgi:hypothetical protein
VRVLAKNGRYYTRDHPHEIIAPGVMRFEEIRHWMREFSTDPAYGWTGRGLNGLKRALGMHTSVADKLGVAWIWPREQVRLTRRIELIREGFIVPRRFGQRVDGVWTDPPCPPRVGEKKVIRMSVGIQGVQMRAAQVHSRLPAFGSIVDHAMVWNPLKNDAK